MTTSTSSTGSPVALRRPDATRRAILKAFGYSALVVFALLYIFPFIIQIGTSFKTDADATANPLNPIPETFTTAAYQSLFQQDLPLWFGNSVIVAVFVTAGRVFFDSLAGYALARLRFRGRGAVTHRDRRHDGGARSRPAHPEVPHHQAVRHVRRLHRHDRAVFWPTPRASSS